MKFLIIVALVAFVAARPDEKTKSDVYERYKDFDSAPIRENERSMLSFAKCFVNEGKCPPDALDFKKMIPEAMKSNCGECSDHQKREVALFIKAIIEKLPEYWEKLNKIHNPTGEYTEGFKKFVDQYGKDAKN